MLTINIFFQGHLNVAEVLLIGGEWWGIHIARLKGSRQRYVIVSGLLIPRFVFLKKVLWI